MPCMQHCTEGDRHLQALYELVHDSQQAGLLAQGLLVGHQHSLAVHNAAALNLLEVVLPQCHPRAHLYTSAHPS